jgi:hypothetical protein
VYEGVDLAMLERTKNFILSKKSGNGYFEIDNAVQTTAYATDLEKIKHCYIVWALTNAGVTEEINEEIEMAKTIAIKNNDNYCLALSAMAMFNSEKLDEAKVGTE